MQRRSHIETNFGDEVYEAEKEAQADKVNTAIRGMNRMN
jgi:hypothetical protein